MSQTLTCDSCHKTVTDEIAAEEQWRRIYMHAVGTHKGDLETSRHLCNKCIEPLCDVLGLPFNQDREETEE